MRNPQCYYCNAPVGANAQFCPQCSQPLVLHGRYRLSSVLGQGGFGVVYAADDLRLNRRCAIKAVPSTSLADQQRIEAEADLLSQYASRFPFIPDIYDLWSETGRTYLAMEYIDGPTLDQTLERLWRAAEVEQFLRTLLGYLAELHDASIIHRDLKPENIKRTARGRYVLLDFGIAKRGVATMTIARALSPDYAPPEQFQGQPTDARSDLYSLAATAYHLLTGQPPASVIVRLTAGVEPQPPHQLVPNIPAILETVLLRMLELDPSNRPPSAQAALELLDRPAAATASSAPALPTAAIIHGPSSAGRPTQLITPPALLPETSVWNNSEDLPEFLPVEQFVVRQRGLSGWLNGTTPVETIAFLPARQRIAVGTRKGEIWLCDLANGRSTFWNTHGSRIWSIACSPDGTTLASGADDYTVRLWRLDDGTLLRELAGHTDTISSVAFTSDGRTIISGSCDGTLRLSDVDQGRLVRVLQGHSDGVETIAVAPDSRLLASGSADRTVQLWNIADGSRYGILEEASEIWSLAFSPDSSILAVGLSSNAVHLWRIANQQRVGVLEGHAAGIGSMAFSHDGSILASASDDRKIRLWKMPDGMGFDILERHTGIISCVAFAPTELTLLSGAYDGTVCMWAGAKG